MDQTRWHGELPDHETNLGAKLGEVMEGVESMFALANWICSTFHAGGLLWLCGCVLERLKEGRRSRLFFLGGLSLVLVWGHLMSSGGQ